MNEIEILEKLCTTSSTTAKAKILQDNKGNKNLVELLEAAYHYKRKFFIKKFEARLAKVDETNFVDVHKMFIDVIQKLETRAIVGNEAKATVELFLSYCTPLQSKWYSRIIRKDLKAGVATDEVAKITTIPQFDVLLAKDGKKCKKAPEIIAKGVWLSPKFDGYRCLAVIENGHVLLFSRNGTIYDNFPTIEDALLKSFPGQNIVFDGEIMSSDFQSMQKSAFASKRGTTVGDVKFHIFDTLDISEWNSLTFKEKKGSRYQRLEALSQSFHAGLELVEQKLVYTMKEVLDAEVLFMAQGHEGAMTCPDIPYWLGKVSNTMLKWKTMISEDCEIIGFYEGKEDTKHRGRLGGFILRQEDGQECECGSGFSDEDRDYIWQNSDEFLGRTVEVAYQEKTNHGILRFPVFKRYRDDKGNI
jgi:DNA ligase-1